MKTLKKGEPVIVSAGQSVSKVVNYLEKSNFPAIVTQGKKYFGLVDLRTIQNHPNKDFTKIKVGAISEKAPRLILGDSLDQVVNKCFSTRFKALAVVDNYNNVVDMFALSDIISVLIDGNMIPNKNVAEVMTSPVVTAKNDSTIAQVITMMRSRGLRRLVIVDNTNKIKGILSARDITEYAKLPKERNPIMSAHKYSFRTLPVDSMVNTKVETIKPSDKLKSSIQFMSNKNISSLIVVDRGKPIGIITLRDILHSYLVSRKVHEITISGLSGFDKNYQQEIINLAEPYYKKIKKRFDIKGLSLHIKRHGNRFSVHVRAVFSRKNIYINDFGWGITEAVLKALKTLDTAILRLKPDEKQIIKNKKKRTYKKTKSIKKRTPKKTKKR